MPAPQDLYRFIIEPIRTADQPGLFLQRFLAGMQNVWDENHDKIESLPEITDYETTPDEAVKWLLWHVGVTRELDALIAGLSVTQLRRIASVIMTFWKQKGTQISIVDLLRFVLALKVVEYYDYFFFRWVLEESALSEEWDGGDAWILEPLGTELDAFRIMLLTEDIKRDVDQTLMRNLLELARPVSERIEVHLLDLLEPFNDADRWNKLSGAGAAPTVDGIFKIISPTTGQWIFTPTEAASWSEYFIKFKFKFTGTVAPTEVFRFYWYSDATWDNAYGIWLQDGAQRIRLRTTGTEGNLGPIAAETIDHDVWYTITIHIQLGNKGLGSEYTRIIAYLDGAELIDFTDLSNFHAGGTVVFEKPPSATDLWIDFIKVSPIPFRTVTVEP